MICPLVPVSCIPRAVLLYFSFSYMFYSVSIQKLFFFFPLNQPELASVTFN